MEWTHENIEKEILRLKEELGLERMPNSTEMRNNKRSGLSAAIGKNGGINYWSEHLNLKMKKKTRKWTEDLVEQEIFKSMKMLQIERMPTAVELKDINRNDLHCIISKGLTYRGWAKRLNLEMKSSETLKGQKYETVVKDMLVNVGHKVQQMTTKYPYDLLVNDNVTNDVMNYTKATKKQLETIALHEDCSVDLKFQVCRTIQERQNKVPMDKYWKQTFYSCFKEW